MSKQHLNAVNTSSSSLSSTINSKNEKLFNHNDGDDIINNSNNENSAINNNNVINETLMNIDDHEPQTTSNGSTQIKPLTTTIEIAESNSISDNGDQLPLITNHRSNIQNRPNRRHQSNQQFYQGKRQYRCPDCSRSFRSNQKRRDHQSKHH